MTQRGAALLAKLVHEWFSSVEELRNKRERWQLEREWRERFAGDSDGPRGEPWEAILKSEGVLTYHDAALAVDATAPDALLITHNFENASIFKVEGKLPPYVVLEEQWGGDLYVMNVALTWTFVLSHEPVGPCFKEAHETVQDPDGSDAGRREQLAARAKKGSNPYWRTTGEDEFREALLRWFKVVEGPLSWEDTLSVERKWRDSFLEEEGRNQRPSPREPEWDALAGRRGARAEECLKQAAPEVMLVTRSLQGSPVFRVEGSVPNMSVLRAWGGDLYFIDPNFAWTFVVPIDYDLGPFWATAWQPDELGAGDTQ